MFFFVFFCLDVAFKSDYYAWKQGYFYRLVNKFGEIVEKALFRVLKFRYILES